MEGTPLLFHAALTGAWLEVRSGPTIRSSLASRGADTGKGTGSYSNPETFATAQSNPDFTNCEIVYIPYLQKYFQYADHCVKCGKFRSHQHKAAKGNSYSYG